MKSKKYGKRHRMLIYRRSLDRIWKISLPLGVILLALWYWSYYLLPAMLPVLEALLLFSACLLVLIGVFALAMRNMAYVQATSESIRLITPFLRVNISYRRVKGTRAADLRQIYPPKNLKGAQRTLLEPFYGQTVVLLELNSYPVKPGTLRFFLPDLMLVPNQTALLLIVNDWMALSTEIDAYRGSWRPTQSRRVK